MTRPFRLGVVAASPFPSCPDSARALPLHNQDWIIPFARAHARTHARAKTHGGLPLGFHLVTSLRPLLLQPLWPSTTPQSSQRPLTPPPSGGAFPYCWFQFLITGLKVVISTL